jgi:hypothetical protein
MFFRRHRTPFSLFFVLVFTFAFVLRFSWAQGTDDELRRLQKKDANVEQVSSGLERSVVQVTLRADDRNRRSEVVPPVTASKLSINNNAFVIYFSDDPWPAEAKIAFQHTAAVWSSFVGVLVPVEINAYWEPLDSGFLGQTYLPVYGYFSGAPRWDTWYPSALANQLGGYDIDPWYVDAVITVASDVNWYLGTDGNPSTEQYDLVTVAMSMIGNALAFADSFDVDTDSLGSWGLPGYFGVDPIIYDRFVINGMRQPLIGFPNPSSELADQLTSNDIFFSGSNAAAANGGVAPKLYAPNPWEPGLSIGHLDEDTYPPGNPNALMTPFLNSGEANHNPGPVALGVLQDLGWSTQPTYSITGYVRDGDGNPVPDVTISAGPSGSGTTDSCGAYTITGLNTGTYTIAPSKSGYTFSPTLRTVSVPPDATGQDFTGTPMPTDTTPPAAITDLTATTGCAPGTVVLSWTAPGDDGNVSTATDYVVRYAVTPIESQFGWLLATDVEGEPAPQPAGAPQSMTISGLVPGETYYFAIVARDEVENTGGLSNSPGAAASSIMPWTMMIYLDGDNDLDPYYVHVFNQLESAADNPCVNVVVAWDRLGNNDSAYYRVKHDANLNQLAAYSEGIDTWARGELNMNTPNALSDFVQWARANYPAQHYVLFISNHGTGLNGTARDWTSGDDLITIRELGIALDTVTSNGTNKIDVVFADSCLMAMIEVAYQIRNYANYYVASENLSWIPASATSCPYDNYISTIGISTSAQDLAIAIVTQYAAWLDADYSSYPYTISAVDLGQINNLTTAVNDLALGLKSQIATYASQLSAAREATQKFDSNNNFVIDSHDEYVDLYHLAEQIRGHISDSTIQNLAQAVMNGMIGYVVNESHDSGEYRGVNWNLDNSHGVSIFFPREDWRRSFYTGDRFDFAAGTDWLDWDTQQSALQPLSASDIVIEWGPMLVEHVKGMNPNALDNPNPPDLAAPLVPRQHVYLPLVLKGYNLSTARSSSGN